MAARARNFCPQSWVWRVRLSIIVSVLIFVILLSLPFGPVIFKALLDEVIRLVLNPGFFQQVLNIRRIDTGRRDEVHRWNFGDYGRLALNDWRGVRPQ